MEDNFSTDVGGGIVQAVMRARGNNGEQWGVADEASLRSPAAHLLPNRVQASTSP